MRQYKCFSVLVSKRALGKCVNNSFLLFNSGFHEAVGDTIALSVSSPKHLRRVGLINGDAEDEQTEINQLYKMVSALDPT